MNEVPFSSDEFYISYNPERDELAMFLDEICHRAGRPEPKNLPETALCVRNGSAIGIAFYILYGDHRPAYAELVPKGLEACMAYFLEHINEISHASDVPEAKH